MNEQIRDGFTRLRYCGDCLETDFYRMKVHIAFLEQSIEGIVKRGKASHEGAKPAYRDLYRKRTNQLRYAQTVLSRVKG